LFAEATATQPMIPVCQIKACAYVRHKTILATVAIAQAAPAAQAVAPEALPHAPHPFATATTNPHVVFGLIET